MTEKKTHVAYLAPSRFIQAGEFNGADVTLTIAKYDREPLPQDKGADRVRGILYFRGTDKGLVLCKTNIKCIEAMFGEWLDDWIGKRVTLFPTMVNFGAEKVLGIRVRGSPDIPQKITKEIKLPKRKAFSMTMIPTQAKPGAVDTQAPEGEQDELL